jgi:hypothetical protein
MKAVKKLKEPSFEPIELTMTIESQEELDTIKAMIAHISPEGFRNAIAEIHPNIAAMLKVNVISQFLSTIHEALK